MRDSRPNHRRSPSSQIFSQSSRMDAPPPKNNNGHTKAQIHHHNTIIITIIINKHAANISLSLVVHAAGSSRSLGPETILRLACIHTSIHTYAAASPIQKHIRNLSTDKGGCSLVFLFVLFPPSPLPLARGICDGTNSLFLPLYLFTWPYSDSHLLEIPSLIPSPSPNPKTRTP